LKKGCGCKEAVIKFLQGKAIIWSIRADSE